MVGCGVCRSTLPSELMQSHHIDPQAAGGSDDEANLVYLCAGCHHNLHRVADMLVAGKGPKAEDTANAAHSTDAGAARRLLEYARNVAREIVAIREGDRDLPPTGQIVLELPRNVITALKELGFSFNNGKPGLRKFCTHVLTETAKRVQHDSESESPENRTGFEDFT